MDRIKLAQRLVYLILFIFVANFLANKFHWYFSTWYTDMFMHFLGGLWIGLISLYLFPAQQYSDRVLLRTLLVVLSVGIGWEIFEVLVNDVTVQNPFDLLDTLSDIFFDLLGGSAAVIYFFKNIMLNRGSRIE